MQANVSINRKLLFGWKPKRMPTDVELYVGWRKTQVQKPFQISFQLKKLCYWQSNLNKHSIASTTTGSHNFLLFVSCQSISPVYYTSPWCVPDRIISFLYFSFNFFFWIGRKKSIFSQRDGKIRLHCMLFLELTCGAPNNKKKAFHFISFTVKIKRNEIEQTNIKSFLAK